MQRGTDHANLLPDRMNEEPAVFCGCSVPELTFMTILAAAFWVPVSLLIASLMGGVTMGFGGAGIGIVATVVVAARVFQRLKAGKPAGFYQLQARLWLARRNLVQAPFVHRTGYWDIGRS